MSDRPMNGKTVIVTGANSGIGKEAALALAGMGARIVMVCRNAERGEAARAEIERKDGGSVDLLVADLSSMAEVRRVAAEIRARCDRIDALLNNAGAINMARTLTVDGYETTFATNHLAYFLLTHLLLDTINATPAARIINVASGAHHRGAIDFDDLYGERGYTGWRAYAQSKLANVLFTFELARRLEGTGTTANAVHPGVVRTGFGKDEGGGVLGMLFGSAVRLAGPLFTNARQGAETSVYLASSAAVEGVTGRYFVKCRPAPSSALSQDADLARRLWDVSEQLTGVASASAPAATQA